MTGVVRLAVVGSGSMGANHIRIARQLPGVELVAVVDSDTTRARQLTAGSNITFLSSVDELQHNIDAAVVAVPTSEHLQVAAALADRGVHLLVEKPLAATRVEAEQLVEKAMKAGVCLAVGHVERFNPAIYELPRFLDNPIHFAAARISPYTPRISDGVVFDLMIHDLDIICSLVGAEVAEVHGAGQRVRSISEDLAVVTMAFSSGQTASLQTSRVGQQKIRTLEVTQAESVVHVDLLKQDVTITTMSSHEYVAESGTPRHRQSNVVEIPFLETRGEPLALELTDFVHSVLSGSQPRVNGEAGLRAVGLAERILAALIVP